MRLIARNACAVVTAGVLVFGMVGCSSSSSTDNSMCGYTTNEVADEQQFETVTFGMYEQDGNEDNGTEAIEWLVIAEEDGQTLLISSQVLDAVAYDDSNADDDWAASTERPRTDVEWADSSLNAWLNDEFLNTAFTTDEQASIENTTLEDEKMNVSSSAATPADESIYNAASSQPKVFLLSADEANTYFDNRAARQTCPTEYALAQGAITGVSEDTAAERDGEGDGYAIWWLRTNGYYTGYAAVVTDDGYIHGAGYRMDGMTLDGADHGSEGLANSGMVGVRPCIWVDSSALTEVAE